METDPKSLNRLFKNFTSLVLSQFFAVLLYVFFISLISRKLGVERYGVFQFSISFPLLFTSVIPLGMDMYLSRDVAQRPKSANMYASIGFPFVLINAIVIYFMIISCSFILGYKKDIRIFLFVSAITYSLLGVYLFISSIFRGLELLQIDAKLYLLEKFIGISLSIALLFIWNSIYSILSGFLLGALTKLAIGWRILINKIGNISFEIKRNEIKKIVCTGIPFLLYGYSIIFNNNIGISFLGKYSNQFQMGFYGSSWQIVNLGILVAISLGNATYPFFAKKAQGDKNEMLNILNIMIPFVFYLTIFFSIIVAFHSDIIIKIFFGNKFSNGKIVLSILSLSVPSIFFNLLTGNIFISYKKHKYLTTICLISSFIILFINVMFTKTCGAIGASIAYIISSYFCTLFFLSGLIRLKLFNNLADILNILFISILIPLTIFIIKYFAGIESRFIPLTVIIIYFVLFGILKRNKYSKYFFIVRHSL